MIRNLNKLTFSGYGKVLQDRLPNRGFPQGDTWQETFWTITDQERQLRRLQSGPLYLDFETGMTILAVSHDSQQPFCSASITYFESEYSSTMHGCFRHCSARRTAVSSMRLFVVFSSPPDSSRSTP